MKGYFHTWNVGKHLCLCTSSNTLHVSSFRQADPVTPTRPILTLKSCRRFLHRSDREIQADRSRAETPLRSSRKYRGFNE